MPFKYANLIPSICVLNAFQIYSYCSKNAPQKVIITGAIKNTRFFTRGGKKI